MRLRLIASIAAAAALLAGPVRAQQAPQDPLGSFIWEMFKLHLDRTLCAPPGSTLALPRREVAAELRTRGQGETATAEQVASALWPRMPCPFSPYRAELRPAVPADIQGRWLYPESSQSLRFGPRTRQEAAARPIVCEAFGYFEGGEYRSQTLMGAGPCAIEHSGALDDSRRNPLVARWEVLREGRIAIRRTDVENHIEEWDVFTVTARFEERGVAFGAGDLVQYLRRTSKLDRNTSTEFRHLKRLAEPKP
jgi:hypothetical protein